MQEDVNVNLLQEGDFVAIKLANYRKHPIIGKALEVNDGHHCNLLLERFLQQGMGATYTSSSQRIQWEQPLDPATSKELHHLFWVFTG